MILSKEEQELVDNFKLPNEIVIVEFIPRKKGMASNVPDDHIISGGMIGDAVRKFRAPLKNNGSIANVLTKVEKAYLEKVTGLELSVYGDFWIDYSVTLRKDSANNRFDMSRPMDYIAVKLLESCTNTVAPNWKSRHDKLTYDFVITRGDEKSKEKKKGLDFKKEAFKAYGRIEDDKVMLIGILKLLTNKPISYNSTLDWVQGEVEAKIDENPKAFLDIVKDPSFDTKVLINKGVEYGVITRRSDKYSTVDGIDLCEEDEVPTYSRAVSYLENPRNQEIRSLIEAKINNAE